MKFNITITNEAVIKKLVSLERKKGEYISKLIEADIRLEELEKKVLALSDRMKE